MTPSVQPIFADRILNIAVTGPVVRLELGALQLPKTQGQKSEFISVGMVVMPLDGFAASFGILESMMKKLQADGILKQSLTAEKLAQQTSSKKSKQAELKT